MSLRPKLELGEGEFGRPVDGDEKVELALSRLPLCDVDVEIADRIALELSLRLFVAFDIGKPADPVTAQAAVQ